MPTRPSRLRRRRYALLPLLLVGALSVGATAAVGLQPSRPRSIPDATFVPVTIDVLPTTTATAGMAMPKDDVAPIADPRLNEAPPPERARPALPPTTPIAVPRATTTHAIRGAASWYCDAGVSPCSSSHPDSTGFDAYGAAGPRLRAAIGADWRGTVVSIDGIRVKLIDWCQCYQGEPNEKLIDLYHDVYLRTGSQITIRW